MSMRVVYFILSFFIGYFFMIVWAASIGNTLHYFGQDNFIDEWLVCIVLYLLLELVLKLRKKTLRTSNE